MTEPVTDSLISLGLSTLLEDFGPYFFYIKRHSKQALLSLESEKVKVLYVGVTFCVAGIPYFF